MPITEGAKVSKEDAKLLKRVFDKSKCLALCASVEEIHLYISCWTCSDSSKIEDSVRLFKHLNALGSSFGDYTLVGVDCNGVHYGENLLGYLRTQGAECQAGFRNLWAIQRISSPNMFVLRVVDSPII